LFVLNDGVVDGKRVVPAGWFREASRAQPIGGKKVDYGYFWWPIPEGDAIHIGAFEAIGIFGQHMYINPKEKLVIVLLHARNRIRTRTFWMMRHSSRRWRDSSNSIALPEMKSSVTPPEKDHGNPV
jgi:CubicO group peptidase (beta-lactamase class C family)